MSCPHGMPTPGSCVDCMEAGPIDTPAEPSRSVPAKYDGHCRICAASIDVGERIVEHGWNWVHEGCAL